MDKEIESTIAAGKQNAATVELVKNWCAHARIEKFGGVGLIEAQTGYPIGHHSLQCDYAPAGGMSCWDLRDAALDFYDRNCITCDKRQPVAIPNLSKLIGERDEWRRAQDAEAAKAGRLAAEQAEARKGRREALRPGLSPIASSILDDIATYDADRTKENFSRLTESARLAPDRFSPELISYLFDLAEAEDWFLKAGLAILSAINADTNRLTKLAEKGVCNLLSYDVASAILIANVAAITPTVVKTIVGPATEVASPDREHFIGGPSPTPRPELLGALWRQFPSEVRACFEEWVSSRKRYAVELAGRGFTVVLGIDPSAADQSARTLASVYARANLLIDDLDTRHEHLPHLSDAIARAFESKPEAVDEIVQQLIAGSDRTSRARAFEIYAHALRTGGFRHSETLISPDSMSHRIAFRRILWAPTTETDDKVVGAACNVFRSNPYELELVARAEIDGLLGAVLILDDRLGAIDNEPREPNEDFLTGLERSNRRSAINSLMSNYVEWASIAAANDEALIAKIIDMIDAIPDGRDVLKGMALGAIEHLATSVSGLKRMLPHLYYGLVGPSTVVRSYAATALSEIRHRGRANIPPLVFEAFCVLLWDQYVIVHKAAVRALRRFSLPEEYRARAAHAVLNLLQYYQGRDGEDKFVVDCIEHLANRVEIFGEQAEAVQRILVDAALKVDPLYLRSELRFLSHALGKSDAFADLVLRMLPESGRDFNRNDESLRLLRELSDASMLKRQDAFVDLGISLVTGSPRLAYEILERLSLAGATEAARRLATACVDQVPNTERFRAIRTTGRFLSIAHAFEAAAAAGDDADLKDLTTQWSLNVAEQERQKADIRERRSRTDLPFAD